MPCTFREGGSSYRDIIAIGSSGINVKEVRVEEGTVCDSVNVSSANWAVDHNGPERFKVRIIAGRCTVTRTDRAEGWKFGLAIYVRSPRPAQKGRAIPDIIHITHKRLPRRTIERWQRLHPGFDVRFYDDDACRRFLARWFGARWVRMFDMMEHGPIKADVFRVCLLSVVGGYYVDADIEPIVPLTSYVDPDAQFVSCLSDDWYVSSGCWTRWNPHVIGATPGCTLLHSVLEHYRGLQKRAVPYDYGSWGIPLAFATALAGLYEARLTGHRSGTFLHGGVRGQLLKESSPGPGDPDWTRNPARRYGPWSRQFCSYLGRVVLYNRATDYDPVKHEFRQ